MKINPILRVKKPEVSWETSTLREWIEKKLIGLKRKERLLRTLGVEKTIKEWVQGSLSNFILDFLIICAQKLTLVWLGVWNVPLSMPSFFFLISMSESFGSELAVWLRTGGLCYCEDELILLLRFFLVFANASVNRVNLFNFHLITLRLHLAWYIDFLDWHIIAGSIEGLACSPVWYS